VNLYFLLESSFDGLHRALGVYFQRSIGSVTTPTFPIPNLPIPTLPPLRRDPQTSDKEEERLVRYHSISAPGGRVPQNQAIPLMLAPTHCWL
jgi:hypothetical protein